MKLSHVQQGWRLQSKPYKSHEGFSACSLPHRPCLRTGLTASAFRGPTPAWRAGLRRVPAPAATPVGTAELSSDGEEGGLIASTMRQYQRFINLAGKFMPMVGLFFLLAFCNTILDSLKDTLVITAVGGGAQVIPYLTVYAVLPSSLAFLLLYSLASQHLSRPALFNGIVTIFMAFFTLFAFVLYPNHHTLHPHGLADQLAQVLPQGVEGLVGMFRNWTFTMFFCMSELWGDVCLGLLFWGLANDTTKLADAPTLYPLFGLGANVAQALGGTVLKVFSSGLALGKAGADDFASKIQGLMLVVVFFMVAALVLHAFIDRKHQTTRSDRAKRAAARAERAIKRDNDIQAAAAAVATSATLGAPSVDELEQRLASNASASSSSTASTPAQPSMLDAPPRPSPRPSSVNGRAASPAAPGKAKGKAKEKPSVREIFKVLAASVPIRCLAIMSLAQGLCTSLMEFAWKSHIGLLFPSPPEFTAFLGDVSMWQGLVTGFLMVLSPAMFDRMGWGGVAAATPNVLLFGGTAFFASCILYQWFFASHAAASLTHAGMALAAGGGVVMEAAGQAAHDAQMAVGAAGLTAGTGGLVLQILVYGGALLFVFSKSAKFSLFKPAEEMVYISLDEEGRTKGKAAIDVVGSQAGKSGGSILQQVLLLASAGAIGGILPIMAVCYFAMAQGWLRSVGTLSQHADYGRPESVHASVAIEQAATAHSDSEEDDHDVRNPWKGAQAPQAPAAMPGLAAYRPAPGPGITNGSLNGAPSPRQPSSAHAPTNGGNGGNGSHASGTNGGGLQGSGTDEGTGVDGVVLVPGSSDVGFKAQALGTQQTRVRSTRRVGEMRWNRCPSIVCRRRHD